jgi:hypothetical protein
MIEGRFDDSGYGRAYEFDESLLETRRTRAVVDPRDFYGPPPATPKNDRVASLLMTTLPVGVRKDPHLSLLEPLQLFA